MQLPKKPQRTNNVKVRHIKYDILVWWQSEHEIYFMALRGRYGDPRETLQRSIRRFLPFIIIFYIFVICSCSFQKYDYLLAKIMFYYCRPGSGKIIIDVFYTSHLAKFMRRLNSWEWIIAKMYTFYHLHRKIYFVEFDSINYILSYTLKTN